MENCSDDSFELVAAVLSAHGLWVECNGFYTRSGFNAIGLENIETRLRLCGYSGGELIFLELDLPTVGWSLTLFDTSIFDGGRQAWVDAAQRHIETFHKNDLHRFGRPACLSST